jgi:hypothetical protein
MIRKYLKSDKYPSIVWIFTSLCIYKFNIFRQCVSIVYIVYPRSYFQRVTYFVINEYEIQLWQYNKYLPLVNWYQVFVVIFGTVIFWHITWVIFWHITWVIFWHITWTTKNSIIMILVWFCPGNMLIYYTGLIDILPSPRVWNSTMAV